MREKVGEKCFLVMVTNLEKKDEGKLRKQHAKILGLHVGKYVKGSVLKAFYEVDSIQPEIH